MRKIEQQLLVLVRAAMNGRKVEESELGNVDWEALRQEAKAQELTGFIYSAIGEELKRKMPRASLEKWKRVTIKTAMKQFKHMGQIEYLIGKLEQKGIELIALKGIVIRNLYPKPELRTMSDGDFLIQQKDQQRVHGLLIEEGYMAEEETPLHIRYKHVQYKPVEMHTTLRHGEIFEEISWDEKSLWADAINVHIGKEKVLSLGPTDLLFHGCTHIATHLVVSGFGIRQLIDIALISKHYKAQIDWEKFVQEVRQWKLEQFLVNLFYVVHLLLEIEIPIQIEELGKANKKAAKLMIDLIFEGGTRGKRNLKVALSHGIAREKKSKATGSTNGSFIRFIFPKASSLSHQYNYAKKYPICLPIAWVHRLLFGEGHKTYQLQEQWTFIITGMSAVGKKKKLLTLLKLQ
ncbi:nucleotidyltransferase domain-containing protein [Niameybacter sp.]|uniref:nucleotidyltransferase domain-containing protein n=1 Tax=Niameybacter sp. TaxID=2033640 RepID=UPI002FC8D67A